ncbi:MAG: SpoIIE family protein phosphatase [Draconibacterium sp.]|nr:SpoIIE family protein phosphatase [Draconibacterium sp.]
MEVIRNHILTLFIEGEADVGICRRKSVSAAKKIGFDEVKTGEVAILVTELVTNVLKHGGGHGKIVVCEVKREKQVALEIWCADIGQGIPDFEKALIDGYSDKISLGIGLGSIRRFSDELEINPNTDVLTSGFGLSGLEEFSNCIRSLKWVPTKHWIGKNRNISVGAVSRHKPGESLNGDTYVVNHVSSDKTITAVIDGLGHGKQAHMASQLAREQILQRSDVPIEVLIKHVHDALRGTRGVVIALAAIDTGLKKITFTGIGNIEGFLVLSDEKRSLISYGGIIGHNMRTPRVFSFPFQKGDFLCLYSDGINTRWNFDDIDWKTHPQQSAEQIINTYSRENDDATVLIIRYDS